MMKRPSPSATSVPQACAAPLVSIILHCRNHGKTLARCLDSILAQRHPNIEIIAYDFASTDATWQIVTDYQDRHPGLLTVLRIRKDYFPDALVEHLQNARGKYVMRFHGNAVLHPELIETCLRQIEAEADVALVRVRTTRLDEQGGQIPEMPLYDQSGTVSGDEHIVRLLMEAPSPFSNVCLFNTDILKLHGGHSNHYTELLLALKYRAGYLLDPWLLFIRPEADEEGDEDTIDHYIRLYLDKRRIAARIAQCDTGCPEDACAASIIQLGRQLLHESGAARARGQDDLSGRLAHLAAAIAPAAGMEACFQAATPPADHSAD